MVSVNQLQQGFHSAACRPDIQYAGLLWAVGTDCNRLWGSIALRPPQRSIKNPCERPWQAIVERLNALRTQQLPAVDAACRRLEGVLQSDPYLQQRLCRVTVEAHSKALYSLHKCAILRSAWMYSCHTLLRARSC